MGRKVAVELAEADGTSYFRSMEEAARALAVSPRALKSALDTGKSVPGTRVKARSVPWKRLQRDRKFYSICYSIPWTYRCGLDRIAEEMGLTLTGLIRHSLISTFTEEHIWAKAVETGLLTDEIFQPLPRGKPRVWLVPDKRRRKSKKWNSEYVKTVIPHGRHGFRDHEWRDRKEELTQDEINLRRRVETLARRERTIKARLRKLGDDEANLRRGDGRFSAHADED